MTESGQIKRMWNRWKVRAREDCFDHGTRSLDMMNLFMAWVMLAGLAFLACIIILLEYYISKKDEPRPTMERYSSNSNNESLTESFYEKDNAESTSELEREWFDFAFSQNPH